MLDNKKVLDLSDVNINDFEAIKRAINDWKESGLSGQFTFVSDEVIKEAFNRGAWRGGFALIAGIAVGALISKGVDHFMVKKKSSNSNS